MSVEPRKCLLDVDGLTVEFATDDGVVRAVDQVSFTVHAGEVVGIVGESGCGKSATALSLVRLLPGPDATIHADRIAFAGQELTGLSSTAMQSIRGRHIGMIFQEPMTALSPLHTIGRQLVEALRIHDSIGRQAAWDTAAAWLTKVGIPNAKARMNDYPFQFSGGMRQRVMIAMALMLQPELVIADEPTTALDVTTQAQILDLLRAMKSEQTGMVFITHDMGVVWDFCDRVIVMYASRIVESGDVDAVFAAPKHPYTAALLAAVPRLERKVAQLPAIPGQVPSASAFPTGCHFHPRCAFANHVCSTTVPSLAQSDGRQVACHKATSS